MRKSNVVASFFAIAAEMKDDPCLQYKHEGEWRSLSWLQTADLIRQYARGLIELGVGEGAPVAILAATRMEWTLLDFAILAARGIVVPIYPNLQAEQIRFIMNDSGARFVIVEHDAMLLRLKEAFGEDGMSNLTILQMEGGGHYEGTITLRALIEHGASCPPERIDERIASIETDTTASFVYTSGTTGEQKGVILTHGNFAAEVVATQRAVAFAPSEICLMCLPLAHVLGRVAQFYVMTMGNRSAYAESFDKLGENFREIRPHFIVGVPRMLEKVIEKVETRMETRPRIERGIYRWAKRIAIKTAEAKQRRLKMDALFRLKLGLARSAILNKFVAGFGGRLHTFVSGGAPMPKDIAKFFSGSGIQILEGYGLTETFAGITANRRDDFHFGTVGKPLDGAEIKLADDGEILVRGPMVFKGYLNKKNETAEAFADGWFKTGDVGEFSKEGFLRITDRKKDIIITAGGKNVAPQRIEAILMESPYINHVMVYGDNRKFLTALITLNPKAIKDFAREEGIMFSSSEELAEKAEVYQLIERIVAEQNKKLARFETIKRFAILSSDFSTENGEITPTLKVRRKYVTQKYYDKLDALYHD